MSDSTIDRQEAEQKLAASLLAALLESIPDHIYFKDLNSRFLQISRSLAGWIGLGDPAQAIAHTDFDFFTEEHATAALYDEQRIIHTGVPLLNVEEKETWPDRTETWVSTSKLPLRDAEGAVVGTFGISRDITERKLAELERDRLWQALAQRNAQLQAVAEISLMTSSILDPEELIARAVELIGQRFGLYYVGLFLVQEAPTVDTAAGSWASLRAGTGEAGLEMKRQGQKLKVGGSSMIGQCIAQGQAYRVPDLHQDVVRFANPLLPETRSELALPLTSRGKTIGALTIQSTAESAFSDQDLAIFQTVAGQLANAIENARLFDQTQASLEEIKAIQRQYIREGWSRYLDRRK